MIRQTCIALVASILVFACSTPGSNVVSDTIRSNPAAPAGTAHTDTAKSSGLPYRREQLSSTFDACAHLFPGGKPIPLATIDAGWKPRGLCSDGFAVLYSGRTRTPIVVVERLNKTRMENARTQPRTGEFYLDPRLPAGERSHPDDYKDSEYDRGHMAPAGDAATPYAMTQTFALSNMVPQDPAQNRKVWNRVESDTRKYVMRASGDVFVFTGPLFEKNPQTIGRNRVWVPSHLYKLVYDPAAGKAWAHVLPNTSAATIGKPMDYASFVKLTSLELLNGVKVR